MLGDGHLALFSALPRMSYATSSGHMLGSPTSESGKQLVFMERLWGSGLLHSLAESLSLKSASTTFDGSLPLERSSSATSSSDSEYHAEMSILACVSLRTSREFLLGHMPRSVTVLMPTACPGFTACWARAGTRAQLL